MLSEGAGGKNTLRLMSELKIIRTKGRNQYGEMMERNMLSVVSRLPGL